MADVSKRKRHAARVAIVGFGTIGKRVAEAILHIPELRLTGIAVRRITPSLVSMLDRKISIFSSDDELATSPIAFAGPIQQMLEECDIVLDCTTRGMGQNLSALYSHGGVRPIYQGGEGNDLADANYCAGHGFSDVQRARSVRIASCNTTGLMRVLSCIDAVAPLHSVRIVLNRSAADPDKCGKGEPNNLVPVLGRSHHGQDIKLFWPSLDIKTMAVTAPINRGHLISMFARLHRPIAAEQLLSAFEAEPRITVLSGAEASMKEIRRIAGTGLRGDCHNVVVWKESVCLDGDEVTLWAGIHMEAIVVPETIDVILGMTGLESNSDHATKRTDRIMSALPRTARLARWM